MVRSSGMGGGWARGSGPCRYAVVEARSGTLALSAAQRPGVIDPLLTDVVMPEMSGLELAQRFAQLKPNAKVLFMSGYTEEGIVRHGVLPPDTAYLQKPFSPDGLARKVRQVLDSGAARTELTSENRMAVRPSRTVELTYFTLAT